MAWLSNNSFSATDKLHAVDMNNVANDIRNWGGDVNGGGFALNNCTIPGVFTDPTTSVGDLIVHGPTPGTLGSLQRLPIVVGDGLALVIDHTQTLGVKWGVAAQGMLDPTTTKGDLIAKPSGAPPTRFPIGADSHILICDSSQATGLRWGTITGFAAPGNDKQVMVNTAGVPGASANLVFDYSKGHLLVGGGADDGSAAVVQVSGIVHATMRVRSDQFVSSKAWAASSSLNIPDAGYGALGYQGGSLYWYWNGSAYGAVDLSRLANVLADPTTTLGDLIVRGSAAIARFGVGPDSYLLVADSTQPLGLRWQPPPAIGVTSAFGRTGAVIAQAGDYTVSMVTNAVDATQSYANPAWITSLPWSKITAAPTFLIDPTTAKGDLITRTTSGNTRIVIGSDGQLLTADSTQATGMKWASPSTTYVTTISPGALSGAVTFTAGSNVTMTQIGQQIQIAVPNINSSTGMSDPTTSQGDLIVHGLTTGTTRMPIGTVNGQILTVDTTQDLGVKWAAPAAFVGVTSLSPGALVGAVTLLGGSNVLISQSAQNITIGVPNVMVDPMTTKGDLVVHGTSTTRLSVGGDGQVLTADSTQTLGVKWAAAAAGTAAGADQQIQVNKAGVMGASPNLLFDYNLGLLTLTSPANTSMYISQQLYTGAQPSAGCVWDARVARGTSAAPTALQAGDRLLDIRGWGYDGAVDRYVAEIVMFAESSFTSGVAYGNIVFSTDNGAAVVTERMRISAAGLVGIGTSSPTEALDVNGHLRLRYVTGMGAGSWLDNSTAAEQCFVGLNAATNMWRVYSALAGMGYNPLTVNLATGVGAVLIQGDANALTGSLGLAQLTLTGSPTTGNNHKSLWLGFDTTNNVGVIQAGISGTGWNSLCFNPSGGNVGIGITNPSVTLHVEGPVWHQSSMVQFSTSPKATSGSLGLYEITSSDASTPLQGAFQLFGDATTVTNRRLAITCNEYNVSWRNVTLCEQGGFVGIAKTAPVVALDVVGAINSTGNITAGLTAGNNALVVNGPSKVTASGSAVVQLVSSGDGANYLVGQIILYTDPTATNRRLGLFATEAGSGARNVTICESGGNVGIGTSTPAAVLDVAGLSRIVAGSAARPATGQGVEIVGGAAGYLWSYDRGASAYLALHIEGLPLTLNATSSGNVGIGTGSPSAQLHVEGAGTTNTNYTPGNATGGTLYLQDTGGGVNNGGQLLFGSSFGPHCGIKAAVQSGSGPGGDMVFMTAVNGGAGVAQERGRVTNGGIWVFGVPVAPYNVTGTGKIYHQGNTVRLWDGPRTPASSSEATYAGELFFDQNYLYIAIANNQIRRIALSAF
jgi:hypothetical protein